MTIKVLSELGFDENKALLLELPKTLINGLKVDAEGTIDTRELLGILLMTEQEKASLATHQILDEALQEGVSDDNVVSFEDHVNLMRMIFDPTCAVDVSYSSPLKQRRR